MTPDLANVDAAQLRALEHRLEAHLDRMDARVDHLLFRHEPPSEAEVTEIDVLCAAINEVRELLHALP
jgi:hypothetical protein